MKLGSTILLAATLSVAPASAQSLSQEDYRAGFITLYQPITSILHLLPNANSVVTEDVPRTGGRYLVDSVWKDIPPEKQDTYTFDSLVIRTNGHGLIDYFEFTSCSLTTHRGISIGDSAAKVLLLYGQPSEDIWLGYPTDSDEQVLSYFKGNSVQGVAFFMRKGRVYKVIIGSGTT